MRSPNLIGSETFDAAQGPDHPPWKTVATAIYLPLTAIAIGWIVWHDGSEALPGRLLGDRPFTSLLAGIATGLSIVLLGRLSAHLSATARRLEVALARLIGPLPTRTCIYLAAVSGIGEEVFFRGALQPLLGITITSIAFGLLHWPLNRNLILWTPFALAAGFIFGGLFWITGGVLAPVVAHALVNAMNMVSLRRHWRPGGALAGQEMAVAPEGEEAESESPS